MDELRALRPTGIDSETKGGHNSPPLGALMNDFGAYLLRTGAISSAQLNEATQAQVIFGGRLGTNLAELG